MELIAMTMVADTHWTAIQCTVKCIEEVVFWGIISNFATEQFELCHLRYVILGFMKMIA